MNIQKFQSSATAIEETGSGSTFTEFLLMLHHARCAIATSESYLERWHFFKITRNPHLLLSINIPKMNRKCCSSQHLCRWSQNLWLGRRKKQRWLSSLQSHCTNEGCCSELCLTFKNDTLAVTAPRHYNNTQNSTRTDWCAWSWSLSTTLMCDVRTWNASHSYISLTYRFMMAGFELKRCTLETRHMLLRYTALSVSMLLHKLCTKWNIPGDAAMFVITGSGGNIRAAVRQLHWKERTFQLAFSDAQPQAPGCSVPCKKAWTIVGHYKHSLPAPKCLDSLFSK